MKNIKFKRINILVFGLLLSTIALANRFECKASTSKEFMGDRGFSATINIETNKEAGKITAKVEKLELSEKWPLPDKCLSPLDYKNKVLIGVKEGNSEIKLFPQNDQECGFIYFFIPGEDGVVTLLSPRKSNQEFGESPYLAECRKI